MVALNRPRRTRSASPPDGCGILWSVPRHSPFHEGFAAIRRQPAVFFSELAWRWTFGLSALLMMAYGALRYSHFLVLTDADNAALKSRVPETMAPVVVRILRDSGEQLINIVVVVALAMAASWMVMAAIGRAATLRALLGEGASSARALLGLSFLRAVLALAAGSATFGAMFVASFAATRGPENRPEIFVPVFLGLVAFVTLGFSVLNWYLSLAPLFAVRERRGTLWAVADTFTLVHRQRTAFTGTGGAFAGVRLLVVVVFTVISLLPLALLGKVPGWLVGTLLVLLALAYFAVSDFLYVARLAAYARIVEEGSQAVTKRNEAVVAHARP